MKSVYALDGDGDVAIFRLSADRSQSVIGARPAAGVVSEPRHEIKMEQCVTTMQVVANNVLYIASRNTLFTIATEEQQPTHTTPDKN